MKNKTVIKGFSAGNDEPMEKEDVKDRIERESWPFLDAYFKDAPDSGRWTSQEICDNVRDTIHLSVGEVNRYMKEHGYVLRRDDDRLVWTKDI